MLYIVLIIRWATFNSMFMQVFLFLMILLKWKAFHRPHASFVDSD